MDETCCEQCAVKQGILEGLITKRFCIAQTLIWQYFIILTAVLYLGMFDVTKEALAMYGAPIAVIVYYYFKSDVERHPPE